MATDLTGFMPANTPATLTPAVAASPITRQLQANSQGQSNDPLSQVQKAIQIRNLVGNLNKLKGGSQTPGVVDDIAQNPYNPTAY